MVHAFARCRLGLLVLGALASAVTLPFIRDGRARTAPLIRRIGLPQ